MTLLSYSIHRLSAMAEIANFEKFMLNILHF